MNEKTKTIIEEETDYDGDLDRIQWPIELVSWVYQIGPDDSVYGNIRTPFFKLTQRKNNEINFRRKDIPIMIDALQQVWKNTEEDD